MKFNRDLAMLSTIRLMHLMHLYVTLTIWVLCSSAGHASASDFFAASSPSILGETGNLQVTPPGWYINPFYNDFVGNTDKLLTHSAKLGKLTLLNYRQSLDTRLTWRIFNPSFEPQEHVPDGKEYIGVYMDWIELNLAYAFVQDAPRGGKWKQQVTLAGNHFGPKGGQNLHKDFHDMIDVSSSHLTYEDQIEGVYPSGGYEAGYIFPKTHLFGTSWQNYTAMGVYVGSAITEVYTKSNSVLFRSRDLKFAIETQINRQFAGKHLDGTKPYRYEAALGFLINGHYKPSIKYVSDYLNGDNVGQIYLDFVNYIEPDFTYGNG